MGLLAEWKIESQAIRISWAAAELNTPCALEQYVCRTDVSKRCLPELGRVWVIQPPSKLTNTMPGRINWNRIDGHAIR